jgi:transketolase
VLSACQIRQIVIEQSRRAGVGHIGSALSIADIIAALYGGIINVPQVKDPERDRFVLSKGHAALALYAALHLRGFIDRQTLDSFCGDGSRLGVHPELVCPGVDFATGSLGQGLSFGLGAALAARAQKSSRSVYVLLSDAECNEGALWESVMFAAHHQLDNLVAIIDLNGQQAFGYTKEVLNLGNLADKWRVFGWHVDEVDGHDLEALKITLAVAKGIAGQPKVLIAKTIFGKGVSFMEHQIKWHYSPLSESEFIQANHELEESKV